jgi:hypothetical protein
VAHEQVLAQQSVAGRLRAVIPPEWVCDSPGGAGQDDEAHQHDSACQPATVARPHLPSVPRLTAFVIALVVLSDSRVRDWQITLPDLTADNASWARRDRIAVDGETQGAYTFSHRRPRIVAGLIA